MAIKFYNPINLTGMNNEQLATILAKLSDDFSGQKGQWQFTIKQLGMYCLTDEFHNRMRIIAPVTKMAQVTDLQMRRCMEANFHSALDVKYAISNDVLWVAFIHPLKELTDNQVVDAVQQVYAAVATFGTSYSSSNLYFPTDEDRKGQMN